MEFFRAAILQRAPTWQPYALIALGYTMVYGVLLLINFAHGDIFMVGAFLGVFGSMVWDCPFVPTLVWRWS